MTNLLNQKDAQRNLLQKEVLNISPSFLEGSFVRKTLFWKTSRAPLGGAWASWAPGKPLRKSRCQKYCVLQCLSPRPPISPQSGEGRKHKVPIFTIENGKKEPIPGSRRIPRIPSDPADPADPVRGLLLGTSRPHAPGVRMT